MRPFKLGDRIKLNETTGNVIEKTRSSPVSAHLKNEVVTIPNSFIMSSHTVNYSASARQFGLIIHSTVSIGYDVPWRQVPSVTGQRCAIHAGSHVTPETLRSGNGVAGLLPLLPDKCIYKGSRPAFADLFGSASEHTGCV